MTLAHGKVSNFDIIDHFSGNTAVMTNMTASDLVGEVP